MKRFLFAVLFGTLAYTIALASAATIGTVTDAGIGAGNTVVASCDTDGVNTAYTTAYSSSTPGYTADAAAFMAGTASNYGWRIADSAEGNSTAIDCQFKSKDAATNAAGAPQLVIVYSP